MERTATVCAALLLVILTFGTCNGQIGGGASTNQTDELTTRNFLSTRSSILPSQITPRPTLGTPPLDASVTPLSSVNITSTETVESETTSEPTTPPQTEETVTESDSTTVELEETNASLSPESRQEPVASDTSSTLTTSPPEETDPTTVSATRITTPAEDITTTESTENTDQPHVETPDNEVIADRENEESSETTHSSAGSDVTTIASVDSHPTTFMSSTSESVESHATIHEATTINDNNDNATAPSIHITPTQIITTRAPLTSATSDVDNEVINSTVTNSDDQNNVTTSGENSFSSTTETSTSSKLSTDTSQDDETNSMAQSSTFELASAQILGLIISVMVINILCCLITCYCVYRVMRRHHNSSWDPPPLGYSKEYGTGPYTGGGSNGPPDDCSSTTQSYSLC